MDYKVKLQNNNNVFRDNNTDLQAVLETINNLPTAGISENLDEEIATQEEKIASQDELIAGIAAALEGKAVGGGGKTTRTININWDEDIEWLGDLQYISNNEKVFMASHEADSIEAEGGIVMGHIGLNGYYTSNFVVFSEDGYGNVVLVATQDGETIHIVNTGDQ